MKERVVIDWGPGKLKGVSDAEEDIMVIVVFSGRVVAGEGAKEAIGHVESDGFSRLIGNPDAGLIGEEGFLFAVLGVESRSQEGDLVDGCGGLGDAESSDKEGDEGGSGLDVIDAIDHQGEIFDAALDGELERDLMGREVERVTEFVLPPREFGFNGKFAADDVAERSKGDRRDRGLCADPAEGDGGVVGLVNGQSGDIGIIHSSGDFGVPIGGLGPGPGSAQKSIAEIKKVTIESVIVSSFTRLRDRRSRDANRAGPGYGRYLLCGRVQWPVGRRSLRVHDGR